MGLPGIFLFLYLLTKDQYHIRKEEEKQTDSIMFITSFYHFCLGCVSSTFCGFALTLTLIKKRRSPFDMILFHNFLNHIFAMAVINTMFFIWKKEFRDLSQVNGLMNGNTNKTDSTGQTDTQLRKGIKL